MVAKLDLTRLIHRMDASEVIDLQEEWRRLVNENPNLRVTEHAHTRSAHDDYFDAALLSNADAHWRKMAYVVGMTMACGEY